MKFTTLQAVLGSAVVLLSAPACSANAGHRRLHLTPRKHTHLRAPTESGVHVSKRGGECAFPGVEELVAITPDAENAGWAMSPDQPCLRGNYCPYACPPGMVMAQWDPDSTYTYPASMNGGLFCDKSGKIKKPFPNKPYCVQGTGAVKAVNKLGSTMSWCQTVLPGNEAMLIPTLVSSVATLAVPDTTYWQGTAAHFYINPPGSGTGDCKWGDPSKPIGNWSPYVAGANTDGNGNTFVKIGLNPIWEDSSLKSNKPSFGVKIECDGHCNGLPCEIAPGTARVSGGGTVGAGGSAFCVVTVPRGSTANIIAYGSGGGSDSDSDSGSDSKPQPTTHTSKAADHAAFAAQPAKTSAASSTSVAATSEATTTSAASTTLSTSTASDDATTTSTSDTVVSTSAGARPTFKAGIFHENSTTTVASAGLPSKTYATTLPTHAHKGEAGRHTGSAAAGLFIALAAAACLL